MANPEHLNILEQGVEVWNKWRKENYKKKPDLSEADLSGLNLCKANLSKADLTGANLCETDLSEAVLFRAILIGATLRYAKLIKTNLSSANMRKTELFMASFKEAKIRYAKLRGVYFLNVNLEKADLYGAILIETDFHTSDLSEADLSEADLSGADFFGTDLKGANFRRTILNRAKFYQSNLENANFVETSIRGTDISNCRIYGISAWNIKISKETKQIDLIISKIDEPIITVDSLEVAQFINLLRHNIRIHHVIDTITSKTILILGRFSEDRKPVLGKIRDALRDKGLVPVLFDFDKPASKDITGTIETLARMARFIIADLTDPSSIPHELATIVPFMRTTPVVPIRLKGSGGYSMFDDFEAAFKWVLPKYEYDSDQTLIESVSEKIIVPAETKVNELRGS